MTVRHVTQHVARPADEVAAFVRDYARLPHWAAGLAGGVEHDGGRWFADSPMGRVEVRFVDDNPFGVCDHDVTLPDGSVTTNPVRVLADGPRACDVVFTLRRAPGTEDRTAEADETAFEAGDAAFEADVAAVTADLVRLRDLLERL